MRIFSVCSGIGGLELALPRSWRVVAWAETDPMAGEILRRHFPPAPDVGDWTALDSLDEIGPDAIVGGLPCQPVSQMDQTYRTAKGDQDQRYLYDALCDLIERSSIRPWLLLENVPALTHRPHRPAFDRLAARLAGLGYKLDWFILLASEVGAPHQRGRWFGVGRPFPARTLQLRLPDVSRRPLLPTPLTRASWTNYNTITNLVPQPPRWSGGELKPKGKRMAALSDDGHHIADWGEWQPAIDLWAVTIGRPPPVRIRHGDTRSISADLVEWMMGFPKGWTSGASNRQRIRLLGQAVVPQQAMEIVSACREADRWT